MARTAFASTYPPETGGVAAHTAELSQAIGGREIIALQPTAQSGTLPVEVHHRIRSDDLASYARTAAAVARCADIVVLQHGADVWGGPDGEAVLDFIDALALPSVATLHDIEGHPTPRQREILEAVITRTAATVVMTDAAKRLLATAYRIRSRKIHVIRHGVPDLPMTAPEGARERLGLAGRRVLLTFGLLGPGKGCEAVLDALPAIVKRHPTACYVVAGATDPAVLRRDGEAYRRSLEATVAARRLGGHVVFVDRFMARIELIRWLQAADIVVTPYPELERTSSGTLAYAMGAGRAIVSTPFAAAAELLADGRGILVPSDADQDLGQVLGDLLADGTARAALGCAAHAHARTMTWSLIGAAYRRLLVSITGVPVLAEHDPRANEHLRHPPGAGLVTSRASGSRLGAASVAASSRATTPAALPRAASVAALPRAALPSAWTAARRSDGR